MTGLDKADLEYQLLVIVDEVGNETSEVPVSQTNLRS
ncbi:hypothetical protein T09_8726 [Trichinella sp. T9]|nr:hypothetical protein T09_8726 [Trichinella sp. T9]